MFLRRWLSPLRRSPRSLHTYFQFGMDYESSFPVYSQKLFSDKPESLGDFCTQKTHELLSTSKSDPQALIATHLENINSQVHKIVLTTQLKIDVETMEQITEIFYPTGGKHLHASLLLLLAKALGEIQKEMATFAEVIEMTYFSHTLHSSVKSTDDSAETTLGVLLSNKAMILGGDFMIGNASIECCRTGRIELVQLLSFIIMNMSKGYCADVTKGELTDMVREHTEILYYRTANLMANGCQGIALLANFDQRLAFDFGFHFGMAFGLCTELKELFNGKISPVSFPVLYASQWHSSLLHSTLGEEKTRDLILESQGINWTRKLILSHVESALSLLSRLPPSEARQGLKGLTLSLLDSLV